MPIAVNGSGTVTGISVGGLPDGIVDTDMLANNAVTAAKSTGLGISMADQWRTYNTQSISANTGTVVTSWERNDNTFAGIGSAMTESSGVFTFPTTGIYLVSYNFSFYMTSSDNRYLAAKMIYNSNLISQPYASIKHISSETFANTGSNVILDVTNTSHELKFEVVAPAAFVVVGNNWAGVGNANINTCDATFIRLGDT
jgi:hypothetical protein